MNQKIKNALPFLSLMFISILFSCTSKMIKNQPVVPTGDKVAATPIPMNPISGIDVVAPIKVKLTTAEGSLPWQVELTKKSELKMNQVVQSQCFYDFMSKRSLIQTNGKTPSDVAKHIQGLSGSIVVHFYYKAMKSRLNPFGTSVVAYRAPPSTDINMNTAYWDDNSGICEFSSTFAHESLAHSLGGYDHDVYYSPSRDYSVPYSVNAAFSACCK